MELLLLLTMTYFRWLLLPFSLLYGLGIWIRNRLYDWNWLRSTSFGKPTIVVGNLAVGGTGKSPMTEYLVGLLSAQYRVATLSRGYGRKTRGFLEVHTRDTADRCGDEPLQIKRKFPHVTVAVDENRVHGVNRLFEVGHEVVVLDDAYQHRALTPGLTVLLFDYSTVCRPKWLLPAGDYRDSFQERRRADIVVVTKTPSSAQGEEKAHIRAVLDTGLGTPVLFSGIEYGEPVQLKQAIGQADPVQGAALQLNGGTVLLLTGIANPDPLIRYLAMNADEVVPVRYPDHHRYTRTDVKNVVARFHAISSMEKWIVTTEKDAQRLLDPKLADLLMGLPVYFIPIRIRFHDREENTFRQRILDYVANE